MALGHRTPEAGLIHYSDRGSQYASGDYQKILSKHGITCSMSRKGNCYDTLSRESFFRLLKTEWVNHHRYFSRSQATQNLFYYIEIFYNRKRRHSALGYATPLEYIHIDSHLRLNSVSTDSVEIHMFTSLVCATSRCPLGISEHLFQFGFIVGEKVVFQHLSIERADRREHHLLVFSLLRDGGTAPLF